MYAVRDTTWAEFCLGGGKMRDIHKVGAEIMLLLPLEFTMVKHEIYGILQADLYLSPELKKVSWARLYVTLSTSLPNPYTGGQAWAEKIGKIVRGEEPGFREGEI